MITDPIMKHDRRIIHFLYSIKNFVFNFRRAKIWFFKTFFIFKIIFGLMSFHVFSITIKTFHFIVNSLQTQSIVRIFIFHIIFEHKIFSKIIISVFFCRQKVSKVLWFRFIFVNNSSTIVYIMSYNIRYFLFCILI